MQNIPVDNGGGAASSSILHEPIQMLAFGIIILAAHLGGRFCRRLKLSEVTGQLLGGAMVGPYALHLCGILSSNSVVYDSAINAMHFFVFVFLSMVAFGIGEELHFIRLRRVGKAAFIICVVHTILTWLVVGGAFYLFSGFEIVECLLIGCIATASAPAVAFVLMNQLKVEGRLRHMVGSLLVITDLVEVVLFSVLLQVAMKRIKDTGDSVILPVFYEMGLAVLLGAAIFILLKTFVARDAATIHEDIKEYEHEPREFDFLHRFLAEHPSPSAEILLIVLGAISIGTGVAYYFHLPFLITAITAGFLVANLHSQAIFDSLKIENITPILNLGFFALVGATISFESNIEATLGLAALYVFTRCVGKLFGTWLGCRLIGEDPKIRACLPSIMLPQAGVAAVEAVVVASVLGNSQVSTIILTGIVFFEIAGVYYVDRNLRKWRSWVADEEKAIKQQSAVKSGKAEAASQILAYLNESRVILDVECKTKSELLGVMVNHGLKNSSQHFDREQALQLLGERERLAPTGFGHGIAIPHCRLMGLDKAMIIFARHKEGIVFGGVDESPCNLIIMILSSARDPRMHLKLLAATSHILGDEKVRNELLASSSAHEFIKIIKNIGAE